MSNFYIEDETRYDSENYDCESDDPFYNVYSGKIERPEDDIDIAFRQIMSNEI